ncbi:Glycosyl hydrolases family 16 [Ruminococcus sp. YE71]|uniref:DUF3592 domain-containing protein n=1 Tax=unclassified Ruminococcus TaxID=2608920 RepID=UPI00087EF904|nr:MULTISPECIES: DUF3592 domain-containing protein [unclassified Ruminococcus]SDA14672.1 Glycosyl hydrolases family 16 [Ruminococcus sp. YE78]SFW21317.1 Glycosyl hydrolases family 16 [Ruminococcus sp. YE71]
MYYRRRRQASLPTTIFIGIISLVLCVSGAIRYFREKRDYDTLMKDCTVQTDAVCIDSDSYVVTTRQRYSSYRTTWYNSKLEYIVDGKKYQYVENSKTEFPVGSVTYVTYDPDDPTKVYVGSAPTRRYDSALHNVIIGGMLLVVTSASLLSRMRNR